MHTRKRQAPWRLAAAFSCLLFLPDLPVAMELSSEYSAVCDRATSIAAQETGVPLKILKAIARTESGITIGGDFVAWPWTINVEGQGKRLRSRSEASDFYRENRSRGIGNIDVGCFQVNHHWHSENFSSPEEMLDPVTNARYAAGFLQELYREFGDWVTAAGAYHSRNREFSEIYLSRLIPIMENIDTTRSPSRENTGGLLADNSLPLFAGPSQSRVRGSLFPAITTKNRSLLGATGPKG